MTDLIISLDAAIEAVRALGTMQDEQSAKAIRSEGYQVAAGYFVKAAQALASQDVRIAELEAVVSSIANSKNVSANGFRIWAKGLCKNALK